MLEASRRVGVRRPRPSRCGRIARNDIAQLFLYAEMDRQAARTRWSPYRILPQRHGVVSRLGLHARRVHEDSQATRQRSSKGGDYCRWRSPMNAEYRCISGVTEMPCRTIDPAMTTSVTSASMRLADAGTPCDSA